MTTRDHLVFDLQDLYAFERDYLPQLLEATHTSGHERLRALLQEMQEVLKGEMETIERGLNLLSAQYKQERNPVVPGFKEATQRYKHQMSPSQEQLDIYAAMEALEAVQMIISVYWGTIEMARAVGEPDVALLLEENLQRAKEHLGTMREFLPTLIQEISRGESRHAA